MESPPLPPSTNSVTEGSESSIAIAAKQKHSSMGIASFATSIGVGFLLIVLFGIAGFLHSKMIPGQAHYPGQVTVGSVFILLIAVDVVAFGLGIASVFESEKKRSFGILGLTFSTLTILGSIGLMAIGLMIMVFRHLG